MALDAIWNECNTRAVVMLKALNLTDTVLNKTANGIGTRVFDLMLPDKDRVTGGFPCLVLSRFGEKEEYIGGTSLYKEWYLYSKLFIADKVGAGQREKVDLYAVWRAAIIDLFDDKPKSVFNVSACNGVKVIPNVAIDLKAAQYQHLISGVRLRYRVAEAR